MEGYEFFASILQLESEQAKKNILSVPKFYFRKKNSKYKV